MRLFLDAQVSGRVVARALRERGHDVRATDEERMLDAWGDERLLELAAAEERVMVTFDVHDFARITGEWAAGGRNHAGCILVARIDHGDFGLILRVLDALMSARPDPEAWRDHVAWGTRRSVL